MKLRARLPRRRESEQTRKRRSLLCKQRQGPDGKWETNQKKAQVRAARRKSLKLGTLFDRCKEKNLVSDQTVLRETRELAAEAEKVLQAADKDAAGKLLKALLPRLNALAVTGDVLRRTKICRTLLEASKRSPALRCQVGHLLNRWKEVYRADVRRAQELAEAPSLAARAARAAIALDVFPTGEASATTAAAAGSGKREKERGRKRSRSVSVSSSSSGSSSSSSSSGEEDDETVVLQRALAEHEDAVLQRTLAVSAREAGMDVLPTEAAANAAIDEAFGPGTPKRRAISVAASTPPPSTAVSAVGQAEALGQRKERKPLKQKRLGAFFTPASKLGA